MRTGKTRKGTFVDLITINDRCYVQTGNADLSQAINGALVRHRVIWHDSEGEGYRIEADTIQIGISIKAFKDSVGDPGKITRGTCAGCDGRSAPFPEKGDYLCIRCRAKQ